MNQERLSIEPVAPGTSFDELNRRTNDHQRPQGAEAVGEILMNAPSQTRPEQVAFALLGEMHNPDGFRAGTQRVLDAVAAGEVSLDTARQAMAAVAGHEHFATPAMTAARRRVIGPSAVREEQDRHLRNSVLLGATSKGASNALITPQEMVAASYELAQRDLEGQARRAHAEAVRETEALIRAQELAAIDPAFLFPAEQRALGIENPRRRMPYGTPTPVTSAVVRPKAGPRPYAEGQVPTAVPQFGVLEMAKFGDDQTRARIAEGLGLEGLAYADDQTAIMSAVVLDRHDEPVPRDRKVAGAAIEDAEAQERAWDARWQRLDAAHDEEGRRMKLGTRNIFLDAPEGGVHRRSTELVPVASAQPEEEAERPPRTKGIRQLGRLAATAVQMKLMDAGEYVASGRHGKERSLGVKATRAMLGMAAVFGGGYFLSRMPLFEQMQHVLHHGNDAANNLLADGGITLPKYNVPVEILPNDPTAHLPVQNPEKLIHHLSTGARHIAPGETIEHQLHQLGIPDKKIDKLVTDDNLGRTLRREGDAYRAADGTWQLRLGDGDMSDTSIRAVYDAAGMDERAHATLVDQGATHHMPKYADTEAERRVLVDHGGLTHRGEAILHNFVEKGKGAIIRVYQGDGFAQIAQRLGLNREQARELIRIAAGQEGVVYREAGELRLQGGSIHLTAEQVGRILRRA